MLVSAYIVMKRAAAAGLVAALLSAAGPGCGASSLADQPAKSPVLEVVGAPEIPRPPFSFDSQDSAFLDSVQRGAFRYLWEVADPKTGMVFDRTSVRVISVAGVGFQLSAIPVGVEHRWISRKEGEERALRILKSLRSEPSNRKYGMFFHYLEEGTARPITKDFETVASTIDSALLVAGMVTASSYFGAEVARNADAMVREVNWQAFVAQNPSEAWAKGFISLGWRPNDPTNPTGPGSFLPYYWGDSGDEQKLVTFLAVAAPDAAKAVPPQTYYRLRRQLGSYGDSGPFSWFPWSGALFTDFFAHCWINYSQLGPDDPAAFGVANRPRVDWWENSRRAVAMHRRKAVENPLHLPTLGQDAWGLGAHDTAAGYAVNGLFPTLIPWPGAVEGVDYAEFKVKDEWGDGTLAPYNAGCAILFEPRASLAALRHYAALTDGSGAPLVWHDPGSGGLGFQDSFNAGTSWSAPDCIAIDQGPLILAIENARSGLVWQLFGNHPVVRDGLDRLKLKVRH